MNIILIGMMGSGKTTVGKKIAKSLGWNFVDIDSSIEEEEKISIPKIFETKGEPYFRTAEKRVIKTKVCGDHTVFATGGGAPCFDENWAHFKSNGFIVWLKAHPQKLFERLLKCPADARPLLKNNMTLDKISEILSKRETIYGKADAVIETDALNIDETVDQILKKISSGKK